MKRRHEICDVHGVESCVCDYPTREERYAVEVEALEARLQHLLDTDPQFAADYAGARIEQALILGDFEQGDLLAALGPGVA